MTAFAQGSSSSTVNVQTISNGDSTTHIETNVNGDDKVVDTKGSGDVTIEYTPSSYAITVSPKMTIVPTATISSTITPIMKEKIHANSVWTSIKNFFVNIFRFF